MPLPSVRLRLTPGGLPSSIEVNGQPLPGVRRAVIDATAGDIVTLTVHFLVHEVEVDGRMVVTVPDVTRNALVALGWTPPSDDDTET